MAFSERLAFGLTNAPVTFQRLIDTCMGDLNLSCCLLYHDDIAVFSCTIEKLQVVFQRLKDAGLQLKTSKCILFQKAIKYLGHLVTENGVITDPDKVKCVQELPDPKCVKDIQSFVGFTEYYRRYIKDFSKIARPLQELTHFKTRGNTKKEIIQTI